MMQTETPAPTLTLEVGSTMIGKDGMKLLYVPEGEFTMGSDKAEQYFAECQKFYVNPICDLNKYKAYEPQHKIYLNAFWLDQTEVTTAMYAKCVQAGACEKPASDFSFYLTNEQYYGNPKYENYSVIYVSWDHANAYCKWADGRLPTEAEWEKAARGTDGRTFPWGEGFDCNKANFCSKLTTEVGKHESDKSHYGIYDMAGNVKEWVADWFSETYYASSPTTNPLGPASGQLRVVRSSSFETLEFESSSFFRVGHSLVSSFGKPFVAFDVGFRCAYDVNP